jgi:hypothetical protein
MEDTTSSGTDTKLVFTDSDAAASPSASQNAATEASQADLQAQLALFQQQRLYELQEVSHLFASSVPLLAMTLYVVAVDGKRVKC